MTDDPWDRFIAMWRTLAIEYAYDFDDRLHSIEERRSLGFIP